MPENEQKAVEHVSDAVTNRNWGVLDSLKQLGRKTRGTENLRMNRDHPDYGIPEID